MFEQLKDQLLKVSKYQKHFFKKKCFWDLLTFSEFKIKFDFGGKFLGA